MNQQSLKIWDPLVRIFHWSLVALFCFSYLTEDDFIDLHAFSGYLIGGLLLFRLLWGLIGTKHARFSDFIYSPRHTMNYLKDIARCKAKRYLGHNPAGGMMVIALLLSLSLTVCSGMLTYGAMEFAGPLTSLTANLSHQQAEWLEEGHEFFAHLTLLLVMLHISGVVFSSVLHKENLVGSMLTGRKPVTPEEHSTPHSLTKEH